ncbi:hypothetical protein [Streptococcus pneumoniae]|uniref:hypothetical protein n=1 Tax=Streptococcus pneumoniae TaxID=1313 RepID=UPI001867D633|nr:hypothetical protein [Streptococcus pneumoniae]
MGYSKHCVTAGCSKHCFKVVDETDEVTQNTVADRTDEVSSNIRQGDADVV